MVRFQYLKYASISLVGLAALAASPVAAGTCGGFLAVDAPTTLYRVSQACSVSIASLREANPGVDPGNVRPGEHLAVPMGIGHEAAPTVSLARADALYNQRTRLPFTEDLGFRARTRQRLRLLAASAAPARPAWLDANATESGHFSSSAPLSFQKIAALRIETANVQNSRTPLLASKGAPLAQFTNDIGVSRGYRLPDYNKIGVAPPVLVRPAPTTISLTGEIDGIYDGCLTLRTADNKIWRLAAAPISDDILGETVTVWGLPATGNACGHGASINVSHAIYAEPWIEE